MPRYFDDRDGMVTTLQAEGVTPSLTIGSGEFGEPEIIRFDNASWAYVDEAGDDGTYVLIEEGD